MPQRQGVDRVRKFGRFLESAWNRAAQLRIGADSPGESRAVWKFAFKVIDHAFVAGPYSGTDRERTRAGIQVSRPKTGALQHGRALRRSCSMQLTFGRIPPLEPSGWSASKPSASELVQHRHSCRTPPGTGQPSGLYRGVGTRPPSQLALEFWSRTGWRYVMPGVRCAPAPPFFDTFFTRRSGGEAAAARPGSRMSLFGVFDAGTSSWFDGRPYLHDVSLPDADRFLRIQIVVFMYLAISYLYFCLERHCHLQHLLAGKEKG